MNVLINMAGTHEYYWSEVGKSLKKQLPQKYGHQVSYGRKLTHTNEACVGHAEVAVW